MNNIVLRACYWIGAIVDAAVAVAMLWPPLLAIALGLSVPPTATETRLALAYGASLMVGWTVLLVWASLKPVARRGVLLLTVVPVIAGLAMTTAAGWISNYIPTQGALGIAVGQSLLTLIFVAGFIWAGRSSAAMDRRTGRAQH